MVEVGIVEWADEDVERVSVERVDEGADLPATEVSGEEEYAFSAGFSALEVLEAVVDGDPGDVVFRVLREFGELSEEASERGEDATKDAVALGAGFFGKGEFEIATTDLGKAPMEQTKRVGEGYADTARESARENGEQSHE